MRVLPILEGNNSKLCGMEEKIVDVWIAMTEG